MSDSGGIVEQIIDSLAEYLGGPPAELLPGSFDFADITDLIFDAGVDVSELSDSDIESLMSQLSHSNGDELASFTDTDTTRIELPDGSKLEYSDTDQYRFGAGLLGTIGAAGSAAGGAFGGYRKGKGKQSQKDSE
jgi:hypothetical protein